MRVGASGSCLEKEFWKLEVMEEIILSLNSSMEMDFLRLGVDFDSSIVGIQKFYLG